jgi:predicted hydrocarbon binding protein
MNIQLLLKKHKKELKKFKYNKFIKTNIKEAKMLSAFLQKLLFINQFEINEGRITILGNKHIMLDASSMLALQEIDKSKIYELGKKSSKSNLDNLVEHAQVYKNIKSQELSNIAELSKKIGKTDDGVLKTLQTMFEVYGLGKLQILDLDNKKNSALIQLNDSSIAATQLKKGKSKTPACTLTSGVLAGIFSYIFGKDVNCVEKKCKAKGDSFCSFEIS